LSRRLFLIRHGQSDFDSRDFLETPRGRQWDPPLSEHGREQAQLLAARLRALDPPAAIWSSPFRRCVETLQPFLDLTGLETRIDGDLGEVSIGEWEGESFEEIVASDEELARRFREQEPVFALAPGGESGDLLRARVGPAIERIISETPQGDIFVFAHGGVINAYVTLVLGIEDQDMFFLPENTSLNTIGLDGAERRVRFINDVRHLTDPHLFCDDG
jgi:broad specificity phosphatase PhoE